jgi:hypothetical protein
MDFEQYERFNALALAMIEAGTRTAFFDAELNRWIPFGEEGLTDLVEGGAFLGADERPRVSADQARLFRDFHLPFSEHDDWILVEGQRDYGDGDFQIYLLAAGVAR